MRKLWVFLLAVPAFLVGAFATIAYQGAVGSLESFRIACELLNTAESAGLLARAQRVDVVESTAKQLRKAAPATDENAMRILEQFKTGCPALPAL